MNISVRWLNRHVDLSDFTPQQIANDLTLSTAETEGITRFGAGLEQLVVGHVVEHGRHPDAEKLTVNQVDIGGGKVTQIVCGAPNVGAGQKVVVIQPGGRLPDVGPKAGIKIKKSKIRGVESLGMICSEAELGLSEDHDGIMVLPDHIAAGTPFLEAFDIADDVIEIDNKSINHRPDLWGHRGIARELAAMHGRALKPLGDVPAYPASGDVVDIDIAAAETDRRLPCARYLGLCLEGVTATKSPDWLRHLLLAVGQRPIDLLVDLTNFVMLDLGQPMHAFDRQQVGGRVGVRFASNGETLTTLDGHERQLLDTDLLITTGGKGSDQGVALAGIMGGEGSMVAPGTTSLFLESANFHPTVVRRTSVRLGLRTDASARFEKALDPTLAADGVHHFVRLLQQECPGAKPSGPLVDPAHWHYEPVRLPLRKGRLDLKLGVDIPIEDVGGILSRLEFGLDATKEGFEVTVPSFRATKDIACEDDLIEEVGRMFRYDNIPELPLRSVVGVPAQDPGLALARRILTLGAAEVGCHEVYNYSFQSDAVLEAVGAIDLPHSRVTNPVAPEQSRLRRHVLPSLLTPAVENLRSRTEVRLMEQGKGYHPEHGTPQGPDDAVLPREVHEVAFLWAQRDGAPYGLLRSHLEGLLSRVGRRPSLRRLLTDEERADLPWLHPGKTVAIEVAPDRDGATAVVGYVGSLHPQVAASLDLPLTTAVGTLDVGALVAVGGATPAFAQIPKFPSQPVDVALLADESLPVGDAVEFLRKCGKKLIRDVRLFEVYRGQGIAEGRKSLNFTVTLGAADRTLSAADEEKFLGRVRKECAALGYELRG